jgi:hypothetical protein
MEFEMYLFSAAIEKLQLEKIKIAFAMKSSPNLTDFNDLRNSFGLFVSTTWLMW